MIRVDETWSEHPEIIYNNLGTPPHFLDVFFFNRPYHMSPHLKGILITTLGVLILSPDALLIRLLHADTWTVVFWRGLAFSVGITLLMLMFYHKNTIQQFKKIGKPGLMIGLIFGISSLLFTTSIQNTSIANTLVIISTSPAFAALFSWIFLKEKIQTRTLITMLILFSAIAMIMWNSLKIGSNAGGFWGDLSAVGTSIFIAISFTFTRKHKDVNMVPAMALSGLIGAGIAAIVTISTQASLHLESNAIPYLILAGAVVSTAFALITLGPRYIPAAEVSLIMPLEIVFGSYLGWIFLGEKPATLTFIGGVIIITTLVVNAWLMLRKT